MKLLLCVVVCAVTCVAQTFPGGGGVTPVTSLPALPCSNGKIATLTTGGVYNCVSGAWVLQQTAITGAPPNWPSLFAPSPHAQSHSGSGSDPITSTGPLTVNGTLSVGARVVGTDGVVTSDDVSTPANPATGKTKTYSKGGKLCSLSPSGSETCTGGSGFSTTVALGDPAVNGSWQLIVSGNNLLIQRRESGAWVTKTTVVP